MTESIFTDIDWDKGTDNPFGLDDGVHRVTISDAEISKASSENLGLWVTFSNDKKRSIRKWLSMPEEGQDADVYERNVSYLRFFLRKQLQIPASEFNKVMKDPNEELVGIECTITVKPQKDNDDFKNITKIVRTTGNMTHGEESPNFTTPTVGSNPGGFNF